MGPVSFELIHVPGDSDVVRQAAAAIAAAGCRVEQLNLPDKHQAGSIMVRSAQAATAREAVADALE